VIESEVDKHFGFAVDLARDCFKALLILNGGAAVALVALAGALAESQGAAVDLAGLGSSVVLFGFGSLLSVLAYGFAYLAQVEYGNGRLALTLKREERHPTVATMSAGRRSPCRLLSAPFCFSR
jgi:hypothetical protein